MMRHHSSRGRAGIALVLIAGAAALALTASGGVAAETGREVAETTVVAAVAAVAPSLPQAPVAPARPAPPTAPNLPDRDELDRAVRDAERAGADAERAGAEAERAAAATSAAADRTLTAILAHPMPDMSGLHAEAARLRETMPRRPLPNCAAGEIVQLRHNAGADGRRYTITCLPATGTAAMAMNLPNVRVALSGAEMSLRMARRQLERETALSDETRATALAGIDQALAELKAEQ